MKLLTEQEFYQIKEISHYETYIDMIKESKILTLEMIGDAVWEVMKDRLPPQWRSLNTRQKDIMYARHFGRYIAKTFTKFPTANISRYFGGRDHSVLYNTMEVIRRVIQSGNDNPMKIDLNRILEVLNERIELL
jgi:chromosomal replication initiation ATPase DnaA